MTKIHVNRKNCHKRLRDLRSDITNLTIIKKGHGRLPDSFYQEIGRFVSLIKLTLSLDVEADGVIVDLGFLGSLQSLECLVIYNTSLRSLENLECCPLKTLLMNNPFADGNEEPSPASLGFLKYCPFLTVLVLDRMNLICEQGEEAQLSPLRHCPVLETLIMRDCRIRSLQGIENHPYLHTLVLSRNLVTDLDPIADCAALRQLRVCGNPIRSLNGIEFCQNLQEIVLSKDHLSTLRPLQSLPELKVTLFVMNLADHGPGRSDSEGMVAEMEELRTRGLQVIDLTQKIMELGT